MGGEAVKVEEVSLSVLQNIVLFDKDGTKDRLDLRPCTLENYISICKKYEKHCVLELKSEFTDEETERFIDIIKKLDYLDSVTFISFHHDNLRKIRKLLPLQSAQFLFSEMTEDDVNNVISEGFDVDVHYKALSKELVNRLHDSGIKVNCWTVDSKDDAEALVAMGVDFITTNILE